jgi:hypothetical protein
MVPCSGRLNNYRAASSLNWAPSDVGRSGTQQRLVSIPAPPPFFFVHTTKKLTNNHHRCIPARQGGNDGTSAFGRSEKERKKHESRSIRRILTHDCRFTHSRRQQHPSLNPKIFTPGPSTSRLDWHLCTHPLVLSLFLMIAVLCFSRFECFFSSFLFHNLFSTFHNRAPRQISFMDLASERCSTVLGGIGSQGQ